MNGLTSIVMSEGRWLCKEACSERLFDIGWSSESKCQACHKEEGTEKHTRYHCPGWSEVGRQVQEACRKWEPIAITSKEGTEVAKKYCNAPFTL